MIVVHHCGLVDFSRSFYEIRLRKILQVRPDYLVDISLTPPKRRWQPADLQGILNH